MASIWGELKRRNVVRVAIAYAVVAWLLLQVADVVLGNIGAPAWLFQAILLVLVIGFPVALIFAWAFELTSEGLKKEKNVDRSQSITHDTGRKLDFVIIAMLVVALGYFGYDKFVLDPGRDAAEIEAAVQVAQEQAASAVEPQGSAKTIAVLPFVNMSDDSGNEYFSDGISEEILNVLTRIPDLRVPSRTSSFSFKGTDTSLETIAEELAVDHVLEGSVRREGDHVRIVAQLIDVTANRTVWSETFDRELTSIFEIQDEIAARVADVLQIRLIGSSEGGVSRTSNADAHDAYLQGLTYVATQASADSSKAIESFERAIELDPQYAAAYAMLASAYNTARMFDFIPQEKAAAEAAVAVERALELDPLLARAYYERSRLTKDPTLKFEDLQRAAELGLNDANAHLSRSEALENNDRHAEARAALEEAVRLDSRSVLLNWMMGSLRLNLGDRIGARGYYRRSINLQPTSPNAYAGMGDVETTEGRLDEAVRWYVTGLKQDPGQPHMSTWVGHLYLSLGDEERAAVWFERGANLLRGHGTVGEFIGEYIPLVRHGNDFERLIELVRGATPEFFGPFGSRIFRKALLTSGAGTGIRAYYEEQWPELFLEDYTIDSYNVEVVPDVAWILRSEGETGRANALLRDAVTVYRANDWFSMYPADMSSEIVEVEILALLGREEEAMNVLRRILDEGWRFGWWQVERDPVLDSIRDHPAVVGMMEKIKADMAMQLAGMPEYTPPSARQ